MMDMIKTVLLDFQEAELKTGVPRRLHVEPVQGKATVCVGVRRCGKSTYMFQIIQKILNRGVPRQNILYLNFFDDRLHYLQKDNLGMITEAYYSIYPKKKNTEKIYCFFDEIQNITGWEPFIDRMMRTEKCEIFLTGSSSRMLSKEIATQMRGRAMSWELFPFSFREFLDCKGIDIKGHLSTKKRLLVQNAFEEYWNVGGFPEVGAFVPVVDGSLSVNESGLRIGMPGAMPKNLRIKTHQEYFHSILFRDIIERYDISHPRGLSDLAHWLVDSAASLYSINRLTGYLKSLSHNTPKSSVSDYIQWFEDAYFLFTVRLFDPSLSRSNANPKKIYCVDHAMVTSVSSGILVNSGHLLENLVFMALRRIHPAIYYYKTKTGREVDFIVSRRGAPVRLIQVCESIMESQTKKRETAALNEAMAELELKTGTIVTRNETERISVKAGMIEVVPAWKFLIDLPDLSE
ncbi:ATP-binding protein [Candidatus Sumerlaeota bacterium]|nr:ATP-binding protein [Candidatus Sumerlaeota bacterium]